MATKKTTKKASSKIVFEEIGTYYKNSTGVYGLVDGKLYNGKQERVSSREIASKKDPLIRCDVKGKKVKN